MVKPEQTPYRKYNIPLPIINEPEREMRVYPSAPFH